ncbi:Rieske (2Fe-2S) protein [Methanoregula sp.]|uniref:Rieske (2Fe-2S) protein n=1 Tax=Methanoregula sp. TaxID=2052170 RepID=UPI0035667086
MSSLHKMKSGLVKDLPVGDMNVVKAGDREILLMHLDTGIYALDNHCIHGGCRLVNGTLEKENLHCPCHNSIFRVKTGDVVSGPATSPQPAYPVILENGEIILML